MRASNIVLTSAFTLFASQSERLDSQGAADEKMVRIQRIKQRQ
jgi:hypothetical protein